MVPGGGLFEFALLVNIKDMKNNFNTKNFIFLHVLFLIFLKNYSFFTLLRMGKIHIKKLILTVHIDLNDSTN